MDFDAFTGGDPHNTTAGSGGNLDESVISVPPYDGEDPQEKENRRRARMFVWGVLRKPGQENIWNYPFDANTPKYLPILMPFLCGDNPLFKYSSF